MKLQGFFRNSLTFLQLKELCDLFSLLFDIRHQGFQLFLQLRVVDGTGQGKFKLSVCLRPFLHSLCLLDLGNVIDSDIVHSIISYFDLRINPATASTASSMLSFRKICRRPIPASFRRSAEKSRLSAKKRRHISSYFGLLCLRSL